MLPFGASAVVLIEGMSTPYSIISFRSPSHGNDDAIRLRSMTGLKSVFDRKSARMFKTCWRGSSFPHKQQPILLKHSEMVYELVASPMQSFYTELAYANILAGKYSGFVEERNCSLLV